MSTDPTKVAQAMTSVIEAHVVLTEFYKEVVAFYRIIDEQLADAHGPVRFDAHMENYIVRYPGDKLKDSNDWLPKWMGRFYCEASVETEEGGKVSGEKADDESEDLSVAFVYVVPYAPDGGYNTGGHRSEQPRGRSPPVEADGQPHPQFLLARLGEQLANAGQRQLAHSQAQLHGDLQPALWCHGTEKLVVARLHSG